MDKITSARPYAKAVFEFALAENKLTPWLQLLEIMAVVAVDPQFKLIASDPRIENKQIYTLLVDLAKQSLHEPMENFLRLICEKQRLDLLPEIYKIYKELLSARDKKVDVDVTTVFSLNDRLQEKLKIVLEKRLKRQVTIHYHLDKTLLGGMVIRAGDLVIDGSIRTRLQRLETALVA